RHVRRASSRAGAHEAALLRPADALHLGPARVDPATRPATPGTAPLDQGHAAVVDPDADRLQVPTAVPPRVRQVHGGAAAGKPGRGTGSSRSLPALCGGEAPATR